jgi:dephospho-CoA kinase
MHVIGLTGGIGTGKSTVAQFLEEQGATVISADLVGHEVYTPGRPSYHELIEAFGPRVVAPDGSIDRKRLGSIVFADPKELAKLNAIVHPRMKGMMRERLQEMERDGLDVAVIEAAILLEAGWDDLTDEIWVTVAPPETAAHRVAERSRLPLEQVLERIRSQMTNEERTKRADIVIDTSGDMESTRRQAAEQWADLKRRLSTITTNH